MRATPLMTVAALAALSFPQSQKERNAHASAGVSVLPVTVQGGADEEIRQLRDALARANRENAKLALQVAGLTASTQELLDTQKAFNRTRRLGTPMSQETQSRRSVEEWLTTQERALAAPVEESEQLGYRAAIASVFSPFNIDRDRRALEELLARHGVTKEADRVRAGADFVEAMARWKGFLESIPSLQRLLAARAEHSVSTPLPPDSAQFLNSAVAPEIDRLVKVGHEYATAKALFLEKVLPPGGK